MCCSLITLPPQNDFISSLKTIDIGSLNKKIDDLEGSPSQNSTDLLCEELNDMILNVAKSCNVYKESQPNQNSCVKKSKKYHPKKP